MQRGILALTVWSMTFASLLAESPYAMCSHLAYKGEYEVRDSILAGMRDHGAAIVRCDLDWTEVEKAPGVWDFSTVDKVFASAEKAGVKVLPVLGKPPKFRRRVEDWKPPYDAEYLSVWRTYVRKMAERYGQRVVAFEIMNEINSPLENMRMNAENYFSMFKAAAEEIRAVDPKIKIVTCGFVETKLEDYLERLYQLGIKEWFDVLNYHNYDYRPEKHQADVAPAFRAVMARHGDGEKPIWVTEYGYPTPTGYLSQAKLMADGLKAARPGLKTWRVVYTAGTPGHDPLPGEADGEPAILAHLEKAFPKGSHIESCTAVDLAARLSKGDVDCVVFPVSESYVREAGESIIDYVRKGGVLVDLGGVPFSYCFESDKGDGAVRLPVKGVPEIRQKLRLGVHFPWSDKETSNGLPTFPTDAAPSVKAPKGIWGDRYFTDKLLQPGDEFIPLLVGKDKNGASRCCAAVYRFNSDMKGALVVSALWERHWRTGDELTQATLAVRETLTLIHSGVDKAFWYEYQSPELNTIDAEQHFGMVHSNLVDKAAAKAYANLTLKERPAGSTFDASEKWFNAARTLYCPQWKRPDGTLAGALWNGETRKRRFVLPFDEGEPKFRDMFGAAVEAKCLGDGRYQVDVSREPIYFSGAHLKVSVK